MKLSFRIVTALAAMLATGALAQTSPSASSPTVSVPAAPMPAGTAKIAIIAFQPAVAQTNEGQRDFGQIQQKFAPRQAQLKALSDEVDSLKKQLQAAGPNLSQDERSTRLKVISDKEKTLQRDAEDAQADFQQQMSEAYQGIAQKFYTVLQDYCVKNGFTLVLDISSQQSPVVYVNQGLDITPAVVQAYNLQSGVPAPTKTAPASTTGTTTTHPSTTGTHPKSTSGSAH
ncbi:MAG: OmpH family outer membrane protein [Acidobacteriaceae bacterium]